MSSAKLTLIGLYQWFKMVDGDLFEHLVLPAEIDRETLINNILLKGGEFEVLYPDADFMKEAVKTWSNKWNRTINKWVEAQKIDYNPLENYDRIEEWDETNNAHSENNNNSNASTSVSAYNSNTLQPESASSLGARDVTDMNNTNNRRGRLHGNIGVTTSQQMLQSEYDIGLWNIYEHITDIFLQEFVLPCY